MHDAWGAGAAAAAGSGDAGCDATPFEVEARLVALARGPTALRRALARVAGRVVATRAWERLGFARLADYAAERAGVSGRELSDVAAVDRALAGLPVLERAFLAGEIGWTKLRLACRVARPGDEEVWLAHARALRVRELEREVREVDERARGAPSARDDRQAGARPAGDPGAGLEDDERQTGVALRCTPRARALWWRARQRASRVAGRALSQGAFAEALAAEVLSAVPLDPGGPEAPRAASAAEGSASARPGTGVASRHPARAAACGPAPHALPPTPPRFVAALERGLDDADAFELDARLRRALRLEAQALARIAAGLAEVAAQRLHRRLGFQSFDAWAEERLGLARSRARALLRIERAAGRCPDLRAAFAEGRVSWVQADALVPLVLEPGAAPHASAWVAHAARVSVRRLRDDVEAALATGELAPPPLTAAPAVPASEPGDGPESVSGGPAGVHTGARAGLPVQTARVVFFVPAEVAHLFRAALATVQRRIERVRGRPSCQGEALEAMLEHALDTWALHGRAGRPEDRATPREYRVFGRDGWRCTVPGCSSYRNLHGHHVVFRSRGGADDLANLTTLCAWHHLRGVHAGRVRVTGTAPQTLRFELGVRRAAPPLLVYGPGEVREQGGALHRLSGALLIGAGARLAVGLGD